ncbi:MAG: hypothetical protein HY897_03890, partial [Deltaproteobacteria bacterium]|nr:hypothetical protein [Deltaproteobacteria bacterium]
MRAAFKGFFFLASVAVLLPPPPDVLAATAEDELREIDQKIQSGTAETEDYWRVNEIFRERQDQERKKPKNDLRKPRFRPNGHGQFQQGFGIAVPSATATAGSGVCGEFSNIYYDCTVLPWDAADGWTRTDDVGAVTVRGCTPGDACVSDGVLGVDSNDGVLFWRMEEGLLTERYASATFRMKQTISE